MTLLALAAVRDVAPVGTDDVVNAADDAAPALLAATGLGLLSPRAALSPASAPLACSNCACAWASEPRPFRLRAAPGRGRSGPALYRQGEATGQAAAEDASTLDCAE
eukprot:6179835-Pleurochrysis_carterae.AAC.7